jgi:uncharacterized protein YbjT (DUF2867 family)
LDEHNRSIGSVVARNGRTHKKCRFKIPPESFSAAESYPIQTQNFLVHSDAHKIQKHLRGNGMIMSLFLVGGTGSLGMEIAKGLVHAKGYTSRKAIVRSIPKATALQELGWDLVEVSDYFDAPALEAALQGAKTVVSTFGGGDIVKLDIATARAAKKVGAELFLPSQFGVDFRRWSSTNPFLAAKGEILAAAKEVGLPTLTVFVGYFSDTTFGLVADVPNCKARIIGDGSAKITFTRRSDIGKVLAEALADPDLLQNAVDNNATLSIAGETLSFKEAVETLEKVTDKKFEIEYLSLEEGLKQEQDLLAKGLQGDVGAFWGSFVLHLLGDPARGFTGSDVSAEANNYGVRLESLSETLTSVYN